MKNLLFIVVLLLSVGVMAQQKPKEVKQETQVKTIKVNDGEKISEKKVKVITREENDVELNEDDAKKVNQERIKSETKVQKTVLVDNDEDQDYDSLSQVTFYKIGEDDYRFTPNKTGFDIAYDNDSDEFTTVGTAWVSHSKGHYIINGKMHDGIGYFDDNGNLVVEYYNKDKNEIESKIYNIKK